MTRGAGRVRGRHELEGTFSPFGERYFENRTYGFEIEDSVVSGGGKVKFTYRPEAPVSEHGAQTNFRHWKIYGDGNVFHSNVTMQKVTPRELVFTVERNAREGRAMQKGDLLEFEFGIFIAGNNAQDPDAIEGRNSYYSDTFRYRVGEGGLTAENADTSGEMGPSERCAGRGRDHDPVDLRGAGALLLADGTQRAARAGAAVRGRAPALPHRLRKRRAQRTG